MEGTVLAFGSFDILHPGHLLYLSEAKKLGSRLVVVVARDSSIELMKGKQPLFNEKDRLKLISSLKMVDLAVLGNRITDREARFDVIKKYRPNVIALGYDQEANAKMLSEWLHGKGIAAKVIRIKRKANPRIYKSSSIKKKLATGN